MGYIYQHTMFFIFTDLYQSTSAMLMSPTKFEACVTAYKQLKSKQKSPTASTDFPAIAKVLTQLEARLVAHSPAWRDISFTLTPTQRKNKRDMVKMWVHRSRTRGLKDISNFFYLTS